MGIFKRKPNLTKLVKKGDVDSLITILGNPEEKTDIRADVADSISLLENGKKLKTIPYLAEALFESESSIRWKAAKSLFTIEDEEAVAALLKALRDEDLEIVQDVLDGKQNALWTSYSQYIKEIRSSLGENAEDHYAVAWLLFTVFTEEELVEQEIKCAILKSPEYSRAHSLLGMLLDRQAYDMTIINNNAHAKEKYENAREELLEAVELDSQDPLPLYILSGLSVLPFDVQTEYYEKALSLDINRNRFFWSDHWRYALTAADYDLRESCGNAFTRAFIIDYNKSIGVKPTPDAAQGKAEIWWQTAQKEYEYYQKNPDGIITLWKQD